MKNSTFSKCILNRSNQSHFINYVNKSIINPREWDFWDYSLLACLIFGTIGNTLSIIVMSTKKLRNTNAALFVSFININFINILYVITNNFLMLKGNRYGRS